MKVLIWLGCAFLYSLVTVGLSSIGIYLGGLPTIALGALMFALARALCKAWDAREPRNTSPSAEQKTPSDFSPPQSITETKEKSVASKVRYCKFCGSPIDAETKKCTGCGKQYFSPAFARRLAIVLLPIALIVSTGLLLKELFHCHDQIEALSASVSEISSDLTTVSQERDDLALQVQQLEKEISTLRSSSRKIEDELEFYHSKVAVVDLTYPPISYYHTRSCSSLLRSKGYTVYTIPEAKQRGYTPCPYCFN